MNKIRSYIKVIQLTAAMCIVVASMPARADLQESLTQFTASLENLTAVLKGGTALKEESTSSQDIENTEETPIGYISLAMVKELEKNIENLTSENEIIVFGGQLNTLLETAISDYKSQKKGRPAASVKLTPDTAATYKALGELANRYGQILKTEIFKRKPQNLALATLANSLISHATSFREAYYKATGKALITPYSWLDKLSDSAAYIANTTIESYISEINKSQDVFQRIVLIKELIEKIKKESVNQATMKKVEDAIKKTLEISFTFAQTEASKQKPSKEIDTLFTELRSLKESISSIKTSKEDVLFINNYVNEFYKKFYAPNQLNDLLNFEPKNAKLYEFLNFIKTVYKLHSFIAASNDKRALSQKLLAVVDGIQATPTLRSAEETLKNYLFSKKMENLINKLPDKKAINASVDSLKQRLGIPTSFISIKIDSSELAKNVETLRKIKDVVGSLFELSAPKNKWQPKDSEKDKKLLDDLETAVKKSNDSSLLSLVKQVRKDYEEKTSTNFMNTLDQINQKAANLLTSEQSPKVETGSGDGSVEQTSSSSTTSTGGTSTDVSKVSLSPERFKEIKAWIDSDPFVLKGGVANDKDFDKNLKQYKADIEQNKELQKEVVASSRSVFLGEFNPLAAAKEQNKTLNPNALQNASQNILRSVKFIKDFSFFAQLNDEDKEAFDSIYTAAGNLISQLKTLKTEGDKKNATFSACDEIAKFKDVFNRVLATFTKEAAAIPKATTSEISEPVKPGDTKTASASSDTFILSQSTIQYISEAMAAISAGYTQFVRSTSPTSLNRAGYIQSGQGLIKSGVNELIKDVKDLSKIKNYTKSSSYVKVHTDVISGLARTLDSYLDEATFKSRLVDIKRNFDEMKNKLIEDGLFDEKMFQEKLAEHLK